MSLNEQMQIELSAATQAQLAERQLWLRRATLADLEPILALYRGRTAWFRERGIDQWQQYLEHHPAPEFAVAIQTSNFFVLTHGVQIEAAFEVSHENRFWTEDGAPAYYVYKIVTRVGSHGLGGLALDICKDLARANHKRYLRIDCKSTNARLGEIYAAHGFRLVATGRKDYYLYALREWDAADEQQGDKKRQNRPKIDQK